MGYGGGESEEVTMSAGCNVVGLGGGIGKRLGSDDRPYPWTNVYDTGKRYREHVSDRNIPQTRP